MEAAFDSVSERVETIEQVVATIEQVVADVGNDLAHSLSHQTQSRQDDNAYVPPPPFRMRRRIASFHPLSRLVTIARHAAPRLLQPL
jgi:hypothetical protein